MKKFLTAVVLLTAMFSVVYGTELKLAYFDSQRIRTDYDDFVTAQAAFDKDVQKWQIKGDSLNQALTDLKSSYEKQYLMLSDDKRKEQELLIQQKQDELQQFLQQVFGSGGLAEQRNVELTKPILERINAVLQQIAAEDGYAVIFDIGAAGSGVVYIDESLDITDKVLEELKKGSASK